MLALGGIGTAEGGREGVDRVGGVDRAGGLLLTTTVWVQLSCWAIVVVLDHLVTVRVLHTVRSLRGGGGEREAGGAVVAAAVVTVVAVVVSAAGSTGLPRVRGKKAAKGKSSKRSMVMAGW